MTINMDLPSPDRVFNLPPPAPTCQICGKNLIVVGIDTENDRSSWVCATHPKKRLERDEPSLQNTSRRPAKTKQLPLKCPTCGRKMNEYGSEDNYPQAWYCLRDNVKIDSLTGTRYSGDMDRDRFIDFRATIRTERSLFLERRLHLTDDALLISKDGQLESRLPLGEISEISTEDYRTIRPIQTCWRSSKTSVRRRSAILDRGCNGAACTCQCLHGTKLSPYHLWTEQVLSYNLFTSRRFAF